MKLRIDSSQGDKLFNGPYELGHADDYYWLLEDGLFVEGGWFRPDIWNQASAIWLVDIGVLKTRRLKESIILYYQGERWDEFLNVMSIWKESWCP